MRILFFDGYCSLCNGLVDWLIRRDHHHRLQFSSLQGETAKVHLPSAYRSTGDVDTVLFLKDGKIYERSTAILYVLMELGFPWSLMGVFLLVPRFLRNAIYRLIAKNRYAFFGKRETCRVPTKDEKQKLLP